MKRWHEEAINRSEFLMVLESAEKVAFYRRMGKCMLCMRPRVNSAGICDFCYGLLDGKELEMVLEYINGARG